MVDVVLVVLVAEEVSGEVVSGVAATAEEVPDESALVADTSVPAESAAVAASEAVPEAWATAITPVSPINEAPLTAAAILRLRLAAWRRPALRRAPDPADVRCSASLGRSPMVCSLRLVSPPCETGLNHGGEQPVSWLGIRGAPRGRSGDVGVRCPQVAPSASATGSSSWRVRAMPRSVLASITT